MAAWAVAIDETKTGTAHELVAVVALRVADLNQAEWVLAHWRNQILASFAGGAKACVFHNSDLYRPGLGACRHKGKVRTNWIRHWLWAMSTRLLETSAIITRAAQPPKPIPLADLAASALQETLALIASRDPGSTATVYRETGTWHLPAPVRAVPAVGTQMAAPVHVLRKTTCYTISDSGVASPLGVPALLGLADYVAANLRDDDTSGGNAVRHVVAQRLHAAIAHATTTAQIARLGSQFHPRGPQETLAHESLKNFPD